MCGKVFLLAGYRTVGSALAPEASMSGSRIAHDAVILRLEVIRGIRRSGIIVGALYEVSPRTSDRTD